MESSFVIDRICKHNQINNNNRLSLNNSSRYTNTNTDNNITKSSNNNIKNNKCFNHP
jgi:hypothetical protein